jgi:hypothetical protein
MTLKIPIIELILSPAWYFKRLNIYVNKENMDNIFIMRDSASSWGAERENKLWTEDLIAFFQIANHFP